MNKKNLRIISTLATICFVTILAKPYSVNASVKRPFAGSNRFDTALKIVGDGWTSCDNIVIASANDANLVDALTASPLAQKLKAPIFLSSGANLDQVTINKIKQLRAKNAYITSGTGAIPTTIEAKLKSAGITTIARLGGNDRYETAVNIAKALGKSDRVMVARGDEYADALSAAAIAAKEGIPILLSDKNSLPTVVKNYITDNNIKSSYVLGLSGALSDNVANALPLAKRLGGSNRYYTNIEIMKEFQDALDFSKVYVAAGGKGNLVDALAGSPLAAKYAAPVVLTDKNLPESTANFLKLNLEPDSDISIFGGEGAVPNQVSNTIDDIQKSLGTEFTACNASVQQGIISILKNISITTAPNGCSKFRVEGSSSTLNIGQTVIMVVPSEKVNVFFYGDNNDLIAKGILDTTQNSDNISFNVRTIK